MNSVHSIESLAAGDAQHKLFQTLGPTLLISMAYIDLGKWLVAVDAGSRFGYDLVLLVLFFNFSAILFQYLSTCIGMVTGKNLAESFGDINLILYFYMTDRSAAWNTIAGMAVGFNLVFEHDNLITAICFASVVVNLLPYTLSRLVKCSDGMYKHVLLSILNECVLHVESDPTTTNLRVLNVMKSDVWEIVADHGVQRRSSHTLGSLFHDHLFSILFIFTGIYLVNYILLSSAADESSETVVMNFQDATELMHQIFTNPAGPIVLLVILLFSSHIISLTCIVSGEVISENFFGVKLPLSAHHLLPKGLAMVLNIYFAKVAGPEGIYQLLIMCPVIQAMLLPSSIIPILRVSSSRLLMGRYRIALCIEIFAFLAFLLVVFTNIIFTAEIMFGTSTWTNNLKGDTGSPAILPYSVVVLISCASIGFTLLLAVTPLKSASNEAQTHLSSMHSQRGALGTTQREATSLKKFEHEEVQSCSVGAVLMGSSEGHKKSVHLRRTLSG
ncbi:Ethylene-insensitive protein 2 [Zea mays]|uniref:Ethylene-insensitive protein 2 n=1 Tax=Zea mays TaxID=4577 RepID=A0A1D6GJY6_MAIZE|nr:Ethylene-insensitive protein 2 [Zea mays]